MLAWRKAGFGGVPGVDPLGTDRRESGGSEVSGDDRTIRVPLLPLLDELGGELAAE